MGLERDESSLFDYEAEFEGLGDVFENDPGHRQRSSAGNIIGSRSHRRSIEELLEERKLRRMLNDLDQEYLDS